MCAVGFSGVISVVVFGLYGSANGKWNMSSRITESSIFDTFWDTLSFMLNGIVFFFAGASAVNFFWRSSEVSFLPIHNLAALDRQNSLDRVQYVLQVKDD